MRRAGLLALGMWLACPARAAEDPGITAAPVLQIPLGSRALGMGGAFTAVASDVSALYYNPAGLSRLNAHEVAVTPMSGIADNKLLHVAYGGPLAFTGLSGNGYSSVGASLLYSSNGTIEVNKTNPDGSLASSESLSAGSDLVMSLGYSEKLGSTPIEMRDAYYGVNHFAGLSGKYVRSTLVKQYKAQTVTADLGYLVNSPEAGLSFGLSALNVGGSLKYVDEADPLPTTVRSGFAYQTGSARHNLILALDGDFLTNEKQWQANVGMEYFWEKSYGLRFGYQIRPDNALGLTAGVGLRWRSRLFFDLAVAMGQVSSDFNRARFTVTYRFGGVAPAARSRERRTFIEQNPEKIEAMPEPEQQLKTEPAPRPRAVPREERQQGVPGWIY